MPYAAPRPCRRAGCPEVDPRGYCDAHKPKPFAGRRPRHMNNSHARGYGASWRKLRTQVLERDGYMCKACASRGHVTTASEVDHVRPKSYGGTDELDNLQALCRSCHEQKTQREIRRGTDHG